MLNAPIAKIEIAVVHIIGTQWGRSTKLSEEAICLILLNLYIKSMHIGSHFITSRHIIIVNCF